ncbi:pentapeptide repeat-containing protein [Streptomyces sp. NPDC085946]|uniref:pentapeptide repeat-containing protein n=1 Tax=Streptomyces sp. NPDC085946 TaxID=3365744 RepID=UPI0037D5F5CF
MSTSEPPLWPHCAHGADLAANHIGCRGIQVPGHTACLAHLGDPERGAYLARLTPGADINHRGTPFTRSLLDALLAALRDPVTGRPQLGVVRFESAIFESDARFESATFKGYAGFRSAIFEGGAWFRSATFEGGAEFDSATFQGSANFESATFQRYAGFESTTFQGYAGFASAAFQSTSSFDSAAFQSNANFESVTFQGNVGFRSATFEGGAWFNAAIFENRARFDSATFQSSAVFQSGIFQSSAGFESATFQSGARFGSVTFQGYARLNSVTFENSAWFGWATFEGGAGFESATFEDDAGFVSAIFKSSARFVSAIFKGVARFESAIFECNACFESATFERAVSVGPSVCTGRVQLSGAVFGGPVTLSFATRRLECRRTRWSSTAEVRLRYATVDFAHAVFEYPLTIAAEPDPFMLTDGRQVIEDLFASGPGPEVRLASLRGVDAAHLVLSDVDLSECLFVGTVHLDQLRLEGACAFDTAPPAVHWRRWRPVRFTTRRVLAEEHHWRASRPGAVRGWNVAVLGAGRAGPLQLAPVYRALRKAFEDGKHEPGAADFYYGEMEMRRHADDIPRSERGLLTAYWALSGYGLRASRALAWLGAAMLLTIVLLMAFGLAKDTPKQIATGTVPAGGGKVTFEIDKDDPQNPTGDRFTGERFEKALNVTLNSVVFRSSGQDLTTAGTYIEMTSRLTEPVLLGLAVLAIRNRVKR